MRSLAVFALAMTLGIPLGGIRAAEPDSLADAFTRPPPETRPWVYWMFMDGNLTPEGITADLEAMQRAGIGGAIILEVNIGIPRGTIDFMSAAWRERIGHAIREARRIGVEIALPAGPGWCGSGGPWVKPEQSMQHLVASVTQVTGPARFDAALPQPPPRTPFFGEKTLTPGLHKTWKEFYRDVVVLAFPTPDGGYRIPDIDEKALYHRAPYSSQPGVKPFLTADRTALPAGQCIARDKIVELKLANGRLVWDVPPGSWTILRFGRTLTGQTTRPAPTPGLGFESDKFDRGALDAHFESFLGALLGGWGISPTGDGKPAGATRGLTTLHFDSWEMSSQNWSERFREEFRRRRGYDLLPWLPVMTGRAVDSVAASERFLWDLRRTAQELVVENHAVRLKELGRRYGLLFSNEPYDLNPAGDLALGAAADVPMGEFWSKGYGFSTEFSVFEAVSIAHTMGRNIVGAEAFTSHGDAWRQHPGAMKPQGDWALCAGINRLVFHRYQHQPWLDRFPGMTFGPYGVHWDRTQTWWEMAAGYHAYLARCQAMLRHGLPVGDILYLDAEDAPSVFRPPRSATLPGFPDRRGYGFDGCAPGALIERASAKDGCVVFPDGASYRLLVLPRRDTMTPALLRKIRQLVDEGATVVGNPPNESPGLEGYPQCDAEVRQLAAAIWRSDRVIRDGPATEPSPAAQTARRGPKQNPAPQFPDSYPDYETTAGILAKQGIPPDFESDADLRYIHRWDGDTDIYFVGNRTAAPVAAECRFRVTDRRPELWDPVTGERRVLPEFREAEGRTRVPLRFAADQSYFVVFRTGKHASGVNFPDWKPCLELAGPWEVEFDPKWGGPERATFAELADWSKRPEEGIRHYSGTATYRKTFTAPVASVGSRFLLDLGGVKEMAGVRLNGRDCGIVWTPPHRADITAALKPGENRLEIRVANLWPNRLIGDAALPAEKRRTFTTWSPYRGNSPLLPSGLLGPVQILRVETIQMGREWGGENEAIP